jgi:hypothetical protein
VEQELVTEDPPSIISETEAERQHGIVANHTRMPNGELRFRLNASDGTGYVRTESVPGGNWQISHYHRELRETYIVQKGWMILVSDNADGSRSKNSTRTTS